MTEADIWKCLLAGAGPCFTEATDSARTFVSNWLAEFPPGETLTRAEILEGPAEAEGLAVCLPLVGAEAAARALERLRAWSRQGRQTRGLNLRSLTYSDVKAGEQLLSSLSGTRLCGPG